MADMTVITSYSIHYTKLYDIEDITEIDIYGDSDKKIELSIDEDALRAYGLNPSDVMSAIKNLSYIFPIGDIDDPKSFIFVSTVNGKASKEEWESTLLHISGKYLRLGEIARVNIYHPQDATLGSFNAKPSLTLAVNKAETGNSIALSKIVREKLEAYNARNNFV